MAPAIFGSLMCPSISTKKKYSQFRRFDGRLSIIESVTPARLNGSRQSYRAPTRSLIAKQMEVLSSPDGFTSCFPTIRKRVVLLGLS